MISDLRGARLFVWDGPDPRARIEQHGALVGWDSGGPPGYDASRLDTRGGNAGWPTELVPGRTNLPAPSRFLFLVWPDVPDGPGAAARQALDVPFLKLDACETYLLEPSDHRPIMLSLATRPRAAPAFEAWMYKRRVYYSRDVVAADDVHVLLDARELAAKRKVQRARDAVALSQSGGSAPGRETIPGDVKIFVWRRDGGHCVLCGGGSDLEFDHVIPLAMGGSNTARNLQILCESCNRAKGAHLV